MKEEKEVQIYIAMDELCPVRSSIESLICAIIDRKYYRLVEDLKKADLVICDDLYKITKDYSERRFYAMLDTLSTYPNVVKSPLVDHIIYADTIIVDLQNLVSHIWEKQKGEKVLILT